MSTPAAKTDEPSAPVVVNYFIDEAGDPTLFGKRKVIVGAGRSHPNTIVACVTVPIFRGNDETRSVGPQP